MKHTLFILFSAGIMLFSCSELNSSDQFITHAVPVIIDSDANSGIDDQHALAYVLLNRDIFDLLGITLNATLVGGDVEAHYAEARRIVGLCASQQEVPLLKGVSGNYSGISPLLGTESFDGIEAVNFIIDAAHMMNDGKLTVIALGKLTNLALAVRKDPSIGSRIRIIWSGSNYPEAGGEIHLESDIPAMNFLLNSDVEFDLLPVRRTKNPELSSGSASVAISREEIDIFMPGLGPVVENGIRGRHGSIFHCFGDYSVGLFNQWELTGNPLSASLSALAAVAILKNPEWAEPVSFPRLNYVDGRWVLQEESDRAITVWAEFNGEGIIQDLFSTLASQTPGGVRDPLKHPFDRRSIWNMPIGDSARYLHAGLQPVGEEGLSIDEDLIIFTPDAPEMAIYENFADWNREKSRCEIEGEFLYSVPFPETLVYSPQNWEGTTPNSGLASLLADRRTIKQTQPFARCQSGEPGTSHYLFPDQDLYGPGIYGTHGGSGLSAVGGAIRLGELMPGRGPIAHALKMNIWAAENIQFESTYRGHRWPAPVADGYAAETYGTLRTQPFVPGVQMGALLALPSWMNLDSLGFETEPGRRLAQAFQDYGAYVVDDTYRDSWAIITAWEADGRWVDQFEEAWGYSFRTYRSENPWSRDVERIYQNLHVVDNNGPESIGGGGTPRTGLAAPFHYYPLH